MYLKNLLSVKNMNPNYELRTENQLCLLSVPSKFPRYKKCNIGFEYAAPKIWNKLPLDIRSRDGHFRIVE